MCALHIVIAGCVKFPINIVHSTIRSIVSETVHPNPNRVDSFVVCPTFNACVSKWIVVCERTCLYVSTPYDNTLNSKSQYIFRNNSYWAHGIAHTPDFEVKSENSAMTIDHFHIVVVDFPAFFFRNHLLCLAKFQMVDNIPFWWRDATHFYLNNYCRKIGFSYNQMISIVQKEVWYDYTHLLWLTEKVSLFCTPVSFRSFFTLFYWCVQSSHNCFFFRMASNVP